MRRMRGGRELREGDKAASPRGKKKNRYDQARDQCESEKKWCVIHENGKYAKCRKVVRYLLIGQPGKISLFPEAAISSSCRWWRWGGGGNEYNCT